MEAATEFLKKASKELGLRSLAAGLDKAVSKPTQYYLYGRDWQIVSQHVIPSTFTWAWMHASTKASTFNNYGEPIPLADVFTEIEARFPGVWTGDFREGARGPTFWDPHGGHKSIDSAVVRENGMQVFNMEKGFYSWSEILGHKFVSSYQQAQIGGAIANFYYDGVNYWEKLDGNYYARKRSDIEIRLKVDHGLSSKTPRGVRFSEIEEALNTIISLKTVDAAAPIVFNKDQVVSFHGKKYLNTSRCRVMEPVDDPQEWAVNFPFVASVLEGIYQKEQLEYWLAWAHRFYKGAYEGKVEAGHAIFTVGDPGLGKTFINSGILGPLFGGEIACGNFLMGETAFASTLFEKGVWTVDDRVPASNSVKHQHYTSTIKSMVANGSFTVEEKFRKAAYLPWMGRLSVTANFTQEDIKMIPELNDSLKDKIMVFYAHPHKVDFGTRQENQAVCEKELPYFARYLLDLKVPAKLLGSNRFGIQSFINSTVEEFALNNGGHAYFLELLDIFVDNHFSGLGNEEWVGTATGLMKELATLDGASSFLKGVDAQRIGRSLSHYHQKGVDWLKRNSKTWTIKPSP